MSFSRTSRPGWINMVAPTFGRPLPHLTQRHLLVHHLRQCADQVPGDVERLISKLDKKANQLGVEDHAKAKEKFLRGILEKY
jgi:hypothetical protein